MAARSPGGAWKNEPLHVEHDGTIGTEVVRDEHRTGRLLAFELDQPVAGAAVDAHPVILQVLAKHSQAVDIQVDRADTVGRTRALLAATRQLQPFVEA